MDKQNMAMTPANPNGTAVAKKPAANAIQALVTSPQFFNEVVEMAGGGNKAFTASVFVADVKQQLRRNPALLKCTPASVKKCCLELARWGISPDGRLANLIPYADECTVSWDFKAFVKVGKRDGVFTKVETALVKANDVFKVVNRKIVTHEINYLKPRGDIMACYVVFSLPDGQEQTEIIEREELDVIRSCAKTDKNWAKWYGEMARKATFKRGCKWLDISPDLSGMIGSDDEAEYDLNKGGKQSLFAGAAHEIPADGVTVSPSPVGEGDTPPTGRKRGRPRKEAQPAEAEELPPADTGAQQDETPPDDDGESDTFAEAEAEELPA